MMFHKLQFPFNNRTAKLLGKALLKCVFTRKRKLFTRLIEYLQRIAKHFVKRALNYDIDTFTSDSEHCEYMSQCALQHTAAEAKTSFLYFSLIFYLICARHISSTGWWLMADDCCAERYSQRFFCVVIEFDL